MKTICTPCQQGTNAINRSSSRCQMKRSATRASVKMQSINLQRRYKTTKNRIQVIIKEGRKYYYPYPPVEAQTRAPLSSNICTQSGRLWRAAKCRGVAPLPSLMFTNLAYPLKIHFQTNKSKLIYLVKQRKAKNEKSLSLPRHSNRARLSSRENGLEAIGMAVVSSIVQAGSSIEGIKHQYLAISIY